VNLVRLRDKRIAAKALIRSRFMAAMRTEAYVATIPPSWPSIARVAITVGACVRSCQLVWAPRRGATIHLSTLPVHFRHHRPQFPRCHGILIVRHFDGSDEPLRAVPTTPFFLVMRTNVFSDGISN
jgi:hypothetical protein